MHVALNKTDIDDPTSKIMKHVNL